MNSRHMLKYSGFLFISILVVAMLAGSGSAEYLNETITDTSDPAYWLDQGGLFATYGNFPMAIDAYKKALALEADNSEAYFNMGVAHAEMGDTDQALVAVNHAISLDARNGRFYYGRAWVYLRAGRIERAMPDFKKAADLGNLDAISYLQQ